MFLPTLPHQKPTHVNPCGPLGGYSLHYVFYQISPESPTRLEDTYPIDSTAHYTRSLRRNCGLYFLSQLLHETACEYRLVRGYSLPQCEHSYI